MIDFDPIAHDSDARVRANRMSAAVRPSLAALLASRAAHLAEVDAIDEDLRARGIRADAKPRARGRDVALKILAALAQWGPLSTTEIVAHTGQTPHACEAMCSRMAQAGEIERVSRGLYQLANGAGT